MPSSLYTPLIHIGTLRILDYTCNNYTIMTCSIFVRLYPSRAKFQSIKHFSCKDVLTYHQAVDGLLNAVDILEKVIDIGPS